MDTATKAGERAIPWNKGKLLGQKPPLKRKRSGPSEFDCNWIIAPEISPCSILPSTANCAASILSRSASMMLSKGVRMASRAIVMQKKTQRPVQFEITEQTRDVVAAWIATAHLKPEQFLFPSRVSASPHLSIREYSRIVGSWVNSIGLDAAAYGTHSMRRTKATMIYRRTRNLRAVQLLLGHTKLESTVRYLGIEVDDALEIAEQTEV